MGGDILPDTPWTTDASQRNTDQPAETCVYQDIGGSIPENIDPVFEDLHQGISHGPIDLVTSDAGLLEINGMECSQSPVSDPSQDPAGILTDKYTSGYSIPLPTWIVDDLLVGLIDFTVLLMIIELRYFSRKSSALFLYFTSAIFIRNLELATQMKLDTAKFLSKMLLF